MPAWPFPGGQEGAASVILQGPTSGAFLSTEEPAVLRDPARETDSINSIIIYWMLLWKKVF
jgi:hypothetical protein